jgi:hypothetical protein
MRLSRGKRSCCRIPVYLGLCHPASGSGELSSQRRHLIIGSINRRLEASTALLRFCCRCRALRKLPRQRIDLNGESGGLGCVRVSNLGAASHL